MKWDEDHESPDVIDRRGEGGGGGGGGFGLLGLIPFVTRFRGGWFFALIIIAVVAFGGIGRVLGHGGDDDSESGQTQTTAAGAKPARPDDKKAHFVAFVLDDTQKTWTQIFAQRGKTYRHAKLVMYTDQTQTACGAGQAATGPFYCPSDERVYIDLAFYDELSSRFGAKGDFAQAYVVAHEIGHHVQKLLGIEAKVSGARGPSRGAEGNSVRLELQADCFAGIWAKSTNERNLLEAGDIDSALSAAAAVGDDRLQKQSSGRVNPETWTHGSSAERSKWFKTGYTQGTIEACDTFGDQPLE